MLSGVFREYFREFQEVSGDTKSLGGFQSFRRCFRVSKNVSRDVVRYRAFLGVSEGFRKFQRRFKACFKKFSRRFQGRPRRFQGRSLGFPGGIPKVYMGFQGCSKGDPGSSRRFQCRFKELKGIPGHCRRVSKGF